MSGGCLRIDPRTEVMLVVDADPKVREIVSDLQVVIEGRSALDQADRAPVSYAFRTKDPSSSSWPFSLALVPYNHDASRTYRLTAMVSDGTGLVGVLRVQSGFVGRKTLELRLYFTEECMTPSLSCAEQETCQVGSCVPPGVDARALPEYVGESPAVDGANDGLVDGGVPGLTTTPTNTRDAGLPSAAPDAGAADPSRTNGLSGHSMDNGMPAPRSDGPGDCGDGVINKDELCDTGIAQGDGACPTLCASHGCLSAALQGTGCQTTCVTFANTAVLSGDGCCPAGADSTTDSDCVAQCGNGNVEMGETCEAADPMHPCPTMDSCRVDTCLIASISGDAALCTAVCTTQLMEQCVAGDGCCPSTCTHDLDSDCSASCGNGVVDATAGETCDKTSPTDPCPSTCNDGDVCTRDYLTGSADNCSATCQFVPISTPFSGDGCCPVGANASNDLDCMAVCGNGVLEPGELCDSNCPGMADCDDGRPCTSDSLTGSGCGVRCTHSAVTAALSGDGCCPSGANANSDNDCRPACGNGVVERGEECDGDCQTSCPRAGTACTENVISGTPCHLKCVAQRITVSRDDDGCCLSGATFENDNDCPRPVCGNNRVEAGEACDGNCPSCEDNNPCTRDFTEGTACNPTCRHLAATTGASDGCCPGSGSSDPDCAPAQVCGNGRREGDEYCDGDCVCDPSSDPCTVMRLVNSPDACHPKCYATARAPNPNGRDGCCPSGSNGTEDTDCVSASVCGNGRTEAGENCDGNCRCPGQDDPCVTTTITLDPDACHPLCHYTSIGPSGSRSDRCCPRNAAEYLDVDCPPYCGNGQVESGEECDSSSASCVNCRFANTG